MQFAKRLTISVLLNIVRSIIIFFTGIILARGLGPEQYGIFSFLLASFAAIITLFDMGTSSAFFSFISKKIRSKSFFLTYFCWILVQFLVVLILILLVVPDAWLVIIWQGESRDLVSIAFIAVFFQNQIWTLVVKVGESQRLTTMAQMLGVVIASAHFSLVILFFWQGFLSIEYIYYLIMVEISVGVVVAKLIFPLEFLEGKENYRDSFGEYWNFCKPMGFADTWLLRRFGGGVEQGYYSAAAQLGVVSLIFTSSVIRVLWKEVAEANEYGDRDRVAYVYKKVSRIVFMLGVVISCFLIPWTEEIIILLLGNQYLEGAVVMSIMLLYPIHQSLGQIIGTMYYALELTRPYVVINSVHLISSIIAIYFLLAPGDVLVPGLELGAVGLGLKMVVLQVVAVNVSMWWLCRLQGWAFGFAHQVIGIGLFLLLGFISYTFVNMILDKSVYILVRGFASGALYFTTALIAFYKVPWLIGLTKLELKSYIDRVKVF